MNTERFELRNARYLAADYLSRLVFPGDTVIDATMGNGGDTLMLCRYVGPTGKVYAFDVQRAALESTRQKLCEAQVEDRAELILAGHETMDTGVLVPVQAVVFNLGWLPGGDHTVTTRTETTIEAISKAVKMIVPGGAVSICVYPGHEEGKRELEAVETLIRSLSVKEYTTLQHVFLNAHEGTPRYYLIQKNRNGRGEK